MAGHHHHQLPRAGQGLPAQRRSGRGPGRLALALVGIVALGSVIGLGVFALQRASEEFGQAVVRVRESLPTPRPTAIATATPVPEPQVGGTYYTQNLDRLWVNETAVWAWKRASDDKDERAKDSLTTIYEGFFIQPGTQVQIVKLDRRTGMVQLDVLDGPHKGKRGWSDTYSLSGQYKSRVPTR